MLSLLVYQSPKLFCILSNDKLLSFHNECNARAKNRLSNDLDGFVSITRGFMS